MFLCTRNCESNELAELYIKISGVHILSAGTLIFEILPNANGSHFNR